MKTLISTFILMFVISINAQTTLYSNDFESTNTGYVTSTNFNDPLWNYIWSGHSGCLSSDAWYVGTSGGYGENQNISGKYASIDYGSQSCDQDISICTQEFLANGNVINISFDWAHQIYVGSLFLVRLYDGNGAPVETLLVSQSTESGFYQSNVAVTPGIYSMDFRYVGNWEWGAKLDNILITEPGSALPIELLDFNAELVDDELYPYALINWEVASESNNNYFTVYHSMDGYEWKEISKVDGSGNHNTFKSYSTIHNRIEYGHNYYKLRQTDYDGMFEEFNIISLERKEPRFEIIRRINPMGVEISEDTKGIHINLWNNGETSKSFHK